MFSNEKSEFVAGGPVGPAVGVELGVELGVFDGAALGNEVTVTVGTTGAAEGLGVGAREGEPKVGSLVGAGVVGNCVGGSVSGMQLKTTPQLLTSGLEQIKPVTHSRAANPQEPLEEQTSPNPPGNAVGDDVGAELQIQTQISDTSKKRTIIARAKIADIIYICKTFVDIFLAQNGGFGSTRRVHARTQV
jgi:hypothetical protein